jgi:hypothetical protein
VNPVVAVFLGAVFLHEPVSTGLVAGAVLVLGAVVLTTRRGAEPADPTRAASPPADPGQDGARAPVPRLNAEG